MYRLDQGGVQRAAELVAGARQIVALTGAGISRPSGIPDFRSAGGLWSNDDPIEVASRSSFQRDPDRFFRWLGGLLQSMLAAQPNPAHHALAALDAQGRMYGIVTQNIDGLHQQSGSRRVFEVHGHLRSATCLECERQVPATPLMATMRRGGVPRCSCGAPFKPDVVLFDEMLPRGVLQLAQLAIERSDLLIVAGTSLEVAPVCDLPIVALRRRIPVVIVNLTPTYLDNFAAVVLHADVATTLPAIVEQALGTSTPANRVLDTSA
jgi:NAD-dependent deacetylase